LLRAAALAAAALLQLAGPLHYVLFEHTRCAAHGELVHGAAGDGHAHAEHAPRGQRSEDPAAQRAPRPEDGDHDHCPVAVQERKDALPAAPQVASTAMSPSASYEGSERDAAFAQAALAAAPKTSPPPRA
jgi:hypothetical protein